MATNRYMETEGSPRNRLERSRASLEDALATLVRDATSLDTAIRNTESMRNIALKLCTVQLAAAVVSEHLCFVQVDVWNEA